MRVLLIHNYYRYFGGEETYVESLYKLLIQNGHQVYLYTKHSKDIQSITDKIKAAIGLFWNFKTQKELTKIIKEFKPDVAHFNNVYPLIGVTAYIICHKLKVPIVQTIHNYRFMCPKGILFRNGQICEQCINKKIFWPSIIYGCYHQSRFATFAFSCAFFIHKYILKAFNKISIFISPSQFTLNYYRKYFSFVRHKIVLLPYFIDLKPSKKTVKKENYFLFIGRLSEEKGILQLLEIFKVLPNQKLKVIGTGPLQNKVDKYKKYKNIIIKGFLTREMVLIDLGKAKALVIPSLWYEVLPFVLIEALILRVPLLISRSVSSVGKAINKSSLIDLVKQEEFKKKIINIDKLSSDLIGKYKNLKYDKTKYVSELINCYKR